MRRPNTMFKRAKTILSLFLTTGIAFACNLDVALAQTLPSSISAAEFAAQGDADGKSYANALQGVKSGNIMCGNPETMCDTATQYCLRCRYSSAITMQGTISQTTYYDKDEGACVAKTAIGNNTKNLSQYWPGNGGCKGTVSIEGAGFLSDNVVSAFGRTSKDDHSFTGADGKEYRIFLGEQPTIQYGKNGDANESFEGCEVLPVKLYNMQSCFFCPLAALIFGAANDITISSFSNFSNSFKTIIIVVFAIWLAIMALQQVFSITKQDAPKFLSAIIKQGFKVLFAVLLLSYSNDLFRFFIIPVLDGGLQMGTHIQSVKLPEPQNWKRSDPNTPQTYYNLPIKSIASSYIIRTEQSNEKDGNTAVYDTLYSRIELYLASLQAQLARMQAIGTTLFCVGSHEIITIHGDEMKDGIAMMFLGGILTAFGFLLTIAFAFYFMDGLLQLAIIGAMLPFMIAGWPLKATAQYASTGFKMLLNTFFVLFFTGFVVSVSVNLVDQSLIYSNNQQETQDSGELRTAVNAGLSGIEEAINEQNIAKLKDAVDIGGIGFTLLIFSCLLGFKFVSQVSPLASNLSSGGFKGGLAGKIGTMGASTIKGMAQKATAPTGKALADQYHAAGGIVGIVSAPVAGLGQLAGKAIGGADQENKAWQDKSFRGKLGAAVRRVTGAPRAAAKKVHSVYRKPKG